MKFIKKVKSAIFWTNFFKVAIPFFIALVVVSLLFNNFSDIFSGDFAKVAETNFNNGKWKGFFAVKLVITFFYSLYLTDKNTK